MAIQNISAEGTLQKSGKVIVSSFYVYILLGAILLDEVLDNYFFSIFNEQPTLYKGIFFSLFLFLQVLASPIQAGFSDFYCRKKSLVVSLCFSVVALLFVMSFYFSEGFAPLLSLGVAASIKALLGNTLPLSWAGIADTSNNNYRFSLALSTSVIAIAYLVLIISEDILGKSNSVFLFTVLFVCYIPLFCIKFFDLIDRRERREEVARGLGLSENCHKNTVSLFFLLVLWDLQSLWKNFLKCKKFRVGLLGVFFPLEISFYGTHALGVDFGIEKFEAVTIFMIIGYLCGVAVIKLCKNVSDNSLIKIGYAVSMISLIGVAILLLLFGHKEKSWMVPSGYFLYSFGVAFIVPSLFSTLSKEREHSEQGKIYGLLGSIDSLALGCAFIVGFAYSYVPKTIYSLVFSFTFFLISGCFYAKFVRTERDV